MTDNKTAKQQLPFRVKISVFLGAISIAILVVVLLIGTQLIENIDYVAQVARDVREQRLPEISENQRTSINIESLRRIAEVAYVSDNPQVRRAARINAQALAAESIFDSDKRFHSKVLAISSSITEIASLKDEIYNNEKRLHSLSKEYYQALSNLFVVDGNLHFKELLTAFFDSNVAFMDHDWQESISYEDLENFQKENTKLLNQVDAICKEIKVDNTKGTAACKRVRSIYKDFTETQRLMLRDTIAASEHWKNVDIKLRELRDSVSSESEWASREALSEIENASLSAKHIFIYLFSGAVIFVILCVIVIHRLIVKPIHWTEQKLKELQQGNLEVHPPTIRIRELAEVADMLERFSSHIAELYSHTSQLEEDSAEKRNLEEVMRAVFSASLDGYSIWDETRPVFTSTGFLNMLGIDNEEEMLAHWDKFEFLDETTIAERLRQATIKGPFREEITIKNINGEHLPLEVTHLPIKFAGKPMILCYVRDLRQQKSTEEELRQAKKQAEEAAKAKSDFLARMSHEIRTPMNGVLGLTHLALEKNPPTEQKTYLEKIQSSARILLGVINDILDFSKIEQDKMTLSLMPFSLGKLITTVTDLFLPLAEQKHLQFILEKDSNIPDILIGDSLRLSQILLNLCSNAIKFTNQGRVTLDIKKLDETDDEVTLQFSIIDTGFGLNAHEIEQIFKPFYQVDNYNTRQQGGTGLGLVITQRLVNLMGADLIVDSIVEVGSNFHFAIKLSKGEEKESNTEQTVPSEEALKGVSVLLVEDNEINQEIGKALLEGMGAEVHLADNGQESIDILQEQDFDIVLMDIQMPIMDGLTATELIRKQGRIAIRNIPIIAMTAHVMLEDKEKSERAGMNAHITKPIDIDELRDKILYFLPPQKN